MIIGAVPPLTVTVTKVEQAASGSVVVPHPVTSAERARAIRPVGTRIRIENLPYNRRLNQVPNLLRIVASGNTVRMQEPPPASESRAGVLVRAYLSASGYYRPRRGRNLCSASAASAITTTPPISASGVLPVIR